MSDNSFLMRFRKAAAQVLLRQNGIGFNGGECVRQLEDLANAAGIASQSAVGIFYNNGSGSATQTAPSGTSGNIGNLDTTKGLVVSTRQPVPTLGGRRYISRATVSLGTTSSTPVDAACIPVVSTDNGATWGIIGRLFSAFVSSDRTVQVSVMGYFAPTAGATAIFGVLIGNVDSAATITCLGERRAIIVEAF